MWLRRQEIRGTEVDRVTVLIGDLRLSGELFNDRQIRLARRLADDHEAWFMYDDAIADRVKQALAYVGRHSDPLPARPEVKWHTLEELNSLFAKNHFSAELLLQHAMHLLNSKPSTP